MKRRSFLVPIMTEWAVFTPTGAWTTNTTYTGFKRRVGGFAEYEVLVSTSGAPDATNLLVNLPGGEILDTAKITLATGSRNTFGRVAIDDAGVTVYPGLVAYNSATAVQVLHYANSPVSVVATTSTAPHTFGAGDSVVLRFSIPIVGWKANRRIF